MQEDLARIKKWYHRNGIPFIASDWVRDPVTGESVRDTVEPERRDLVRFVDPTWWGFFEKGQLPWKVHREPDVMAALEEFFAPYIAMLPRPKGNVIRQLVNDSLTYQEIADDQDLSRQGAWKQVNAALSELVRLVARDDPAYVAPRDGRRRDKEAEREAAGRVLDSFWKQRFGDGYLGLSDV